ncbi:hypothetical protein H0176_01060 [Methylorubrum populi]|nr:hypothetical protein [Methylorubrum populi]
MVLDANHLAEALPFLDKIVPALNVVKRREIHRVLFEELENPGTVLRTSDLERRRHDVLRLQHPSVHRTLSGVDDDVHLRGVCERLGVETVGYQNRG